MVDERKIYAPNGPERQLEFKDFQALELKGRRLSMSKNFPNRLGGDGRTRIASSKSGGENFLIGGQVDNIYY